MKKWTPCCFTNAEELDELNGYVNDRMYSMTSGKGGAPINVPIKSVKPDWNRQAMFVHIDGHPFVTHKLTITREAPNRYRVGVVLTETARHPVHLLCRFPTIQVYMLRMSHERMGAWHTHRHSAPSRLGSFDGCLFDLAPGDEPSKLRMFLEGGQDPVPSGPEWQ